MLGEFFSPIFYYIGIKENTMFNDEEMNFAPDLYTLVDENGEEQTFELLDAMEYEGERYYALTPYYPNAEDLLNDDGELTILKSEFVDDEEMMVSIENDEEFEKIAGIFLERIEAIFEEPEDEDDF